MTYYYPTNTQINFNSLNLKGQRSEYVLLSVDLFLISNFSWIFGAILIRNGFCPSSPQFHLTDFLFLILTI